MIAIEPSVNSMSLVIAAVFYHLAFIAPSIIITANNVAVRVSPPNTSPSQINISPIHNTITHNSWLKNVSSRLWNAPAINPIISGEATPSLLIPAWIKKNATVSLRTNDATYLIFMNKYIIKNKV